MEHTLILIFSLLFMSASFASCEKEIAAPTNSDKENIYENNNANPTGSKMKIKIGTSTFTATL